MILGVYWYFKFPDNLYHFQFFDFSQGIGGHANNPAELITTVQVENPQRVLASIEELVQQNAYCFAGCKVKENIMHIYTGGYNLYDFTFSFAKHIELILQQEGSKKIEKHLAFESSQNYTFQNSEIEKFEKNDYRFIQLVGSNFKKYNAENFSIRIDCNINTSDKENFIDAVKVACSEENIHVFYYHESKFQTQSNLMMFFSNGRQRTNTIQNVILDSFGRKMEAFTQKYNLSFGFAGGYDHYPLHHTHTELMVDEEFIHS